jgi:hypothetical protein
MCQNPNLRFLLFIVFCQVFLLPFFYFFDLAFYCFFSFLYLIFLLSFVFPFFFTLVYFFSYVVSSVAYHNLLENKRLNCGCIPSLSQQKEEKYMFPQ